MTRKALVEAEYKHEETKNLANVILTAHESMTPAISYLSWAYKDFVEFVDTMNLERWRLSDKRFVHEAKRFNWKWDEKLAQKI